MSQLVPFRSSTLPEVVAAAGERASMRFVEFFATNIRNPHTRRAYARVAEEFLAWCGSAGVPSIGAVQPVHVATWIEGATRARGAERQATARRASSPVRLARHRPGGAGQPVRLGAGAPPRRDVRANACSRSRGSARALGIFIQPELKEKIRALSDMMYDAFTERELDQQYPTQGEGRFAKRDRLWHEGFETLRAIESEVQARLWEASKID